MWLVCRHMLLEHHDFVQKLLGSSVRVLPARPTVKIDRLQDDCS